MASALIFPRSLQQTQCPGSRGKRVSVAEDTALALSISLLLGGLMMEDLTSKSQGFTQHH